MLKLIIAGAAVAEAALVLNQPAEFLQMGMTTRRQLASLHEKQQNRMTEKVMANFERAAAKSGKSYAQYITDMDEDEEDNHDDNDDLIGPDGLEHELMDEKATLSTHDFTAVRDEDEIEPDAYEGEDSMTIDANDDATNFGETDDGQDE